MKLPPGLSHLAGWLLQRRILARRVDAVTGGIAARILAPAVWKYRDGLTNEEIGALLDITPTEVRERLVIAAEEVKRVLHEVWVDDPKRAAHR